MLLVQRPRRRLSFWNAILYVLDFQWTDFNPTGAAFVLDIPLSPNQRSIHSSAQFLADGDFANDCDEEESDECVIAYKRRSVAWTRRYQKLIPYEKARSRAMSLGLRSADEWDDYLGDGKYQAGPYLPTRPDLMYRDDWVSWDEFLGIMRPYEDSKSVVQMIGLRNETQYRDFVMADPKRAEGLRIPAKPEIVYRGKGWISYPDFLGNRSNYA